MPWRLLADGGGPPLLVHNRGNIPRSHRAPIAGAPRCKMLIGVDPISAVFANRVLVTRQQLLTVMTRTTLATHVRAGRLLRVWHGVYAQSMPDAVGRLGGLELMTGRRIVACLATAAQLYGFDTENDDRIHILDPGVRMRPNDNLMVHQRLGAPLSNVAGRLLTSPPWTAVEVARLLRRPRALATLDSALRSGTCTRAELHTAVDEQKGRRGIVNVRNLLPYADPRAESPLESETRLVFIDGGLPMPELQYEIVDRGGKLWRVDFAWPDAMVVVEYDSMQWHASADALRHDRMKTARLQECGFTVIPIVVDDVRQQPHDLIARILHHLDRAA